MWMSLLMTTALATTPLPRPDTRPGPCEATAELPDLGAATIAGERGKGNACWPTTVTIGDQTHPATAGPGAFAESPSADLRKAWVSDVLLAWGQVEGMLELKKNVVRGVAVEMVRDRKYHAQKVDYAVTFGDEGVTIERTPIDSWRMAFFTKSRSVEGADGAEVLKLVNQQGAWYLMCFREHVLADPRVEDFARIQFVINGGKATKLAATKTTDPDITQCYANALNNTPFPKEMKAKVEWGFAIRKSAPK